MVVWVHQNEEEEKAVTEFHELPGLCLELEMELDNNRYDGNKKNLIVLRNRDGPPVKEILESSKDTVCQGHDQQIKTDEYGQYLAKHKFVDLHTVENEVMHIDFTLFVVDQKPFRTLDLKDSLPPGDLLHGSK